MSYNDLTNIKKINGIPADLNYFSQVIENDSYFKTEHDGDEDLTALDRNIVPVTDLSYSLGTNLLRFNNGYISNLFSSKLSVDTGTLALPSLKIGSAGFTSLNNGELSFVGSAGLESLKFLTSGLEIKAANNTQLKIQNTLAGSESLWSIGSDENGLRFAENATDNKLLVKTSSVDILNKLRLQVGTIINPSLTFINDITTGMSKDASNPIINFSVSGSKALGLSAAALEVLASQIVIPTGSLTIPSLVFAGSLNTGLSSTSSNEMNLIFNNQRTYNLRNDGVSHRLEVGANFDYSIYSDTASNTFSFKKAKGTISVPAPIALNDTIYQASFYGQDSTDLQFSAEMVVQSEEAFSGSTYGTGIYFKSCSVGESTITDKLALGQASKADAHFSQSIGFNKILLDTPGTGLEVDVRHISKIMVDATSGLIEIKGFTGGQEGQMLYIYKKVTNNTFRILFNSGTATQKVLLKDSLDYQNANNYGGITLSFDDGIWREVSRS
jgi:hypothetical protein